MSKQTRLPVDLGARSYEIVIGQDILGDLGSELRKLDISLMSPVLVITDENVNHAGYLSHIKDSLTKSGYNVFTSIVPAGEQTKTLESASKLFDDAFTARLDRKSTIIAIGGGVVGDLAGFIAATYMRGISFIQVPTTVMAHDSAVGGKVAVNHPRGKNIIGAFYQPLLVLYDVNTLLSLPVREVSSGLAEVIKHGLIWDPSLFEWVEAHIDSIFSMESDTFIQMLAQSCSVKTAVVAEDETEQGLRMILNFGHTLGHAIEEQAGYGSYTHGEAISIGIAYAAALSNQLGLIDYPLVERIERILTQAKLPIFIPDHLQTDSLIQSMLQDKKATGGVLSFVLLQGIGQTQIKKDIPLDIVRQVIEERRMRHDG